MDIVPSDHDRNINHFDEDLQSDLLLTRTSLAEVTATLNQSQHDLNRLTQIKANITAQLQQISGDSDTISKADIRTAFNSALDTQQRLLVMRGQSDKLQEQKNGLQKYKTLLEKALEYYQSTESRIKIKSEGDASIVVLEMLINSQESERQKLARQMNDGPAQALSNFIVQAEIVSRLFEMDPNKAKEEIEKLKTSSIKTFQKTRTFITELRPMVLDDLGLIQTIKKYVNNTKEVTGIDISETVTGSYRKLKPFMEVFIFRAIQELVGNSIKHNIDNSSQIKIDVVLSFENSEISIKIKDNGKGFEPLEIQNRGELGIKLIRERTQLLGGGLEIISSDSEGTEVNLKIPVKSELVTE
ncbi:MAG: sensor histidine kinase [Chloroflexi bacterium]|nr:sensor histidine kinase [Chloroflexota bacterium]